MSLFTGTAFRISTCISFYFFWVRFQLHICFCKSIIRCDLALMCGRLLLDNRWIRDMKCQVERTKV